MTVVKQMVFFFFFCINLIFLLSVAVRPVCSIASSDFLSYFWEYPIFYIYIPSISNIPTSNFTCAEPNTYLGRPKLLSSTVDSDGRTLHVPNLIRGEKKLSPSLLKIGK